MQRDRRFFSKKASRSRGYEAGSCALHSPAGACDADDSAAAPSFGEALTGMKHHEFPVPLNGVEFQPSETCPKNFVIFDQTYNKSRVMFHPSLAHNFGSSSFDIDGTHAHEAGKSMDGDNYNTGVYSSSPHIEDAEDIDALLSSEEEDDDDVVSTGRTPGNWSGGSPDSSCSFSDGMRSSSKSKFDSANAAGSSQRKREKMKKMVKTLRGIIPGGDRMDTPAVLDEAVKYLKSLKVEVKKLGVHKFES